MLVIRLKILEFTRQALIDKNYKLKKILEFIVHKTFFSTWFF